MSSSLTIFFLNFNLFVFTSHVPQGGIINLSMPDTEDLVWGNPSSYTPFDESSNQDQTITELTEDDIPSVGYFGLDVKGIRERLEGLNFVEVCNFYEFDKAEYIRQQFIQQINFGIEKKGAIAKANDRLLSAIASERYLWERRRTRLTSRFLKPLPSMGQEPGCISGKDTFTILNSLTGTGLESAEFQNRSSDLFVNLKSLCPAHADETTDEDLEEVLAIWDFIGFCRTNSILDISLGFADVLGCIFPNQNSFPTVSQITYDEIGCCLTGALFFALKPIIKLSEIDFQELSVYKPLNILTWQYIAYDLISIVSVKQNIPLQFKSKMMVDRLLKSVSGDALIIQDILYLLLTHPLISEFLGDELSTQDTENPETPVETLESESNTSLASIIYKVYSYNNFLSFASDLNLYFTSVVTTAKHYSALYKSCGSIIPWLRGLLVRNNYLDPFVENFPDKAETESTSSSLIDISFFTSTTGDIYTYHLLKLEAVLRLLRFSDSDGWSKENRLEVIKILMHEISHTNKFRDSIRQEDNMVSMNESNDSINDVTDDSELKFPVFEKVPPSQLNKQEFM